MKCYSVNVLKLCLVVAAIVAACLIQSANQTALESNRTELAVGSPSFDMLQFLDDKIACQENSKDVRCWSSVNKLQMFAAEAAIEHEAVGVRIEKYHELINDVWNTAASNSQGSISRQDLIKVLSDEFPHRVDESTGEITFCFADDASPIVVMNDLIEDYSDTIETWRLLQSWAAAKADGQGSLHLTPAFSQEAVEEFRDFLSSFDIALFKRAKQIANSRKLAAIDAESMAMAFQIGQPSTP